jgi:DNA-binding XRE family transcriptional regulator
MKSDVSANLKKFREQKNLTQEQMAELLGYSLFGYRKIEQGQRGLPIHKVIEVAKILNCSIEDIFLP